MSEGYPAKTCYNVFALLVEIIFEGQPLEEPSNKGKHKLKVRLTIVQFEDQKLQKCH